MCTKASRGVTLIELVLFIVIVGIGMAAVFAAFNTMTAGSASPQVRKQALAIAESMMEEVTLMPFTWCDPDDPAAATATLIGDCTTTNEDNIGPETGETRYSPTTPFDNVNDYHGFTMLSGINDITNNPISGLGDYKLTDITVSQVAFGPGAEAISAGSKDALMISITVTGPAGVSITLEGYRTRYAPTTLP